MASVFSKIISKDIPAHCVAEDEHFLAFLDMQPLVMGHVLVIPKKEIDYIFDLDQESYLALMAFTKMVAEGINRIMPCKKIGLAVIGLEVPHAHIHLIPINQVEDMNFAKEKLRPSNDELAAIAKKISAAIKIN